MKNKKQEYWFKRKRYGYGWAPASRQGWWAIAVYIIIVLGSTFLLLTPESSDSVETSATNTLAFFGIFAASTAGIMILANTKGPKPKWRWGKKPGDNPDEDW